MTFVLVTAAARAQNSVDLASAPESNQQPQVRASQASSNQTSSSQTSSNQTASSPVPDGQNQASHDSDPQTKQLSARTTLTPEQEAERIRISKLAILNGRPYDQPSTKDTLIDYAKDTYGWSGMARTSVRALYSQARGTPTGWGQDWPGFGQRMGASAFITAVNGNVRLGMELLFHEDLRYLPCHGCRKRDKIYNALLSEITARHDEDGHRFFTLTPTIADFSGPIIAHSTFYPTFDPMAGVISTRLVFATRVGQHLFQEFVLERRHHDEPSQK
jgi:hypothetical protein